MSQLFVKKKSYIYSFGNRLLDRYRVKKTLRKCIGLQRRIANMSWLI